VTKDWSIKVCDFGLSRFFINTNMTTFYQLRGTMCYCAPETYQGKQFTSSSDIFSLGIILWEMLHRVMTGSYQRPYSEYSEISQPIQIIIQVSQNGLRPTIPMSELCPSSLVQLIQSCWDPEPSRRPSTSVMLEQLKACEITIDKNQQVKHETL